VLNFNWLKKEKLKWKNRVLLKNRGNNVLVVTQLKNEVIYLVESVEVAFAIVAPNSAIVLQTQLLMSTTHSSVLLFLYKSWVLE